MQQWKTSVLLATCDRSARIVYLRCVMRTHFYNNSVAITRTKVPFVEEGEAYWEMNKTLILLHVSSTISQTCQCKSHCDGTKLTRMAFLPTSRFYLRLTCLRYVNSSYLVSWAQLILVSITIRRACTKRLGANKNWEISATIMYLLGI